MKKTLVYLAALLLTALSCGTKDPGAPPPHRLARAPWPCAKTQGTGERRLVTLARSPRLVSGGGVRAHLRSLVGAFCFSVEESSLLSTDLFPWSTLAVCAKRDLQRKTWFWGGGL